MERANWGVFSRVFNLQLAERENEAALKSEYQTSLA
jgi:hypothetical protein